MPSTPTCPDCEVTMRESDHKTSHRGDGIRIDAGGGVLGALDLKGEYLDTYVCPECGLVRFYADST